MIRCRALDQRITIQRAIITQDSELNPIETWEDWLTVWAEAIPKDSREYFRLQTMNSETTEAFKIYYVGSITSHMRVKFKNRYFPLIGEPINTGERNEELILTCKAVA